MKFYKAYINRGKVWTDTKGVQKEDIAALNQKVFSTCRVDPVESQNKLWYINGVKND